MKQGGLGECAEEGFQNGDQSQGENIQREASGTSLDYLGGRRERGDLIQAYKVSTGKENVSYKAWFKMCEAMDRERPKCGEAREKPGEKRIKKDQTKTPLLALQCSNIQR